MLRDVGCSVVLSGENVAGAPAHVGAELLERLDQNCRLHRHVQGAHDTHPFERLLVAILFASRHEAWHFMLGDFDLFLAKVGEVDVFDLIVGGGLG